IYAATEDGVVAVNSFAVAPDANGIGLSPTQDQVESDTPPPAGDLLLSAIVEFVRGGARIQVQVELHAGGLLIVTPIGDGIDLSQTDLALISLAVARDRLGVDLASLRA